MPSDRSRATPRPAAAGRSGANALDLLDAATVETNDLLARLGDASPASRPALVDELTDACVRYARARSAVFDPALRSTGKPELLAEVSLACAELCRAGTLLAELGTAPPKSVRFDVTLRELATLLDVHGARTRKSLFPAARAALGSDRVLALGERIKASEPLPSAKPSSKPPPPSHGSASRAKPARKASGGDDRRTAKDAPRGR